jgi:hypothetical protein
MPARRRRPKQEPVDPVTQFGRLLRESTEREQAARDRAVLQRNQAKLAAKAAAERAEALKAARQELARAIDAVKAARVARHGVAEADAAWRQAKARLLFLETGELPPWHRADQEVSEVPDVMSSDADDASVE